jgi:hypothetical protein
VLEDDNTDSDDVESEGDEVVYMEGGGSCSRVLGLEDARDRVVDMMVDDGGEEGEECCCRRVSMQDTTTGTFLVVLMSYL